MFDPTVDTVHVAGSGPRQRLELLCPCGAPVASTTVDHIVSEFTTAGGEIDVWGWACPRCLRPGREAVLAVCCNVHDDCRASGALGKACYGVSHPEAARG